MNRFVAVAAALSAVAALAGCTADIQHKEEMLAAAGFRVRLADTPAKATELAKLPPQHFMMAPMKNGTIVYFYADPAGCNCVYYGGERAYSAYQRMVQAQSIADKQLMAASMMQDASWNWSVWGPGWGPYGWYY